MAKKTNVGSTAVPVRPQSNKLEHRIAVLPEHVQRRMAWLEQEATLLGDQTTGTGMATQAAYERLQAAQTDVGIATERASSDNGDPAAIEDAKRREAQARQAYESAMQRQADGIRAMSVARDLLGDAKRFISATPVETLVDARPELPKDATVASCRANVARLKEERLELERLPVSIDEALFAVRQQVENAARDGMPSVSGAASPARQDERGRYVPAKVKVTWPVRRLHEVEPNHLSGDYAAPTIVDTARVVTALMKDQLLPLLEADVREAYEVEGTKGIDQHERHKRLRALNRQIADAERLAAEAAWAAQKHGESIEWWPGIPAAALLGVQVDAALLREARAQETEVSGGGRQMISGH